MLPCFLHHLLIHLGSSGPGAARAQPGWKARRAGEEWPSIAWKLGPNDPGSVKYRVCTLHLFNSYPDLTLQPSVAWLGLHPYAGERNPLAHHKQGRETGEKDESKHQLQGACGFLTQVDRLIFFFFLLLFSKVDWRISRHPHPVYKAGRRVQRTSFPRYVSWSLNCSFLMRKVLAFERPCVLWVLPSKET